MIRAIFLEAHEPTRGYVAQLLHNVPGIATVGQAMDSDQLLVYCSTFPWDVAVVSDRALGEKPFKYLDLLRNGCPNIKIVLISLELDRRILEECLSLGIAGIVTADEVADELVAAVQLVASGEPYISAQTRAALGWPPLGR